MKSFKPGHSFGPVKTLVHWSKKPTWPCFLTAFIRNCAICISRLFVSLHRWIYQTQDPFFCLQIFSCVSAVLKTDKSAEVRRAAVLVITLILQGLGKSIIEASLLTNQSKGQISLFGPIRVHHFHDLSHTYMYQFSPCTILCMCSFGCINRWQFYVLIVLSSQTSGKGNFCYLGNLIKK